MIFDSVVCAIDPTPVSLDAARQSARLTAPEGKLVLAAVTDVGTAAHAGYASGDVLQKLREEMAAALQAAAHQVESVHSARSLLLEGSPIYTLKETIEQEGATLVCVGSHGFRRTAGMVIGSVATTLLHDAKCSVLVARAAPEPERFPRAIVVGLDGSPPSAVALDAAQDVQRRFGVSLTMVLARSGKAADADAVSEAHPGLVVDSRSPVDALVATAQDADLLVVGSRGRHGLLSLGSVSERVAHEAPCSVLVVR